MDLAAGNSDSDACNLSNTLFCSAWMAIVRLRDGSISTGQTGSFPLPPAVAALVRTGVELGDADDRILRVDGSTNNKQRDGTVGMLTGGLIDRTEYYRHALLLTLIPFMQKNETFYGT